MRILFVVQRYGEDIAGGSERCAREFAEHLAARGHDVHVLTSCARSYRTWADELPSGRHNVNGVTVHRLRCGTYDFTRHEAVLSRTLGAALLGAPTPRFAEDSLITELGPRLIGFDEWLTHHGPEFDVAVVVTYLYYPGWRALPVLRALGVPTLFHPTAHAEPQLVLATYDQAFAAADAFGYLTEEEQALVESRFAPPGHAEVIGIGVDLDVARDTTPGRIAAIRCAHGLGDDPYVVYVGRLDREKGIGALLALAAARANRGARPCRVVLVGSGDAVTTEPIPDGVVLTGFLPDADVRALLAGSLALVSASPYESFSMVCTEAWACHRPVLVTAHSEVLAGQVRRSGGGLVFASLAELDAGIDVLLDDPGLADALGDAGRRFCEERYDWAALLPRYEALLRTAITRGHARRLGAWATPAGAAGTRGNPVVGAGVDPATSRFSGARSTN